MVENLLFASLCKRRLLEAGTRYLPKQYCIAHGLKKRKFIQMAIKVAHA